MTHEEYNHILETQTPSIFEALSAHGKRAYYPPDIPVQADEAKGAEINGTIGIFTDGDGGAVPLPTMEKVLALEGDDRNRAFLYSPVAGIPELRKLWREWQRAEVDDSVPSTLPFVTSGLAHGLSMVADLFGGKDRAVAVAVPFWGNYKRTFHVRTEAVMKTAPNYRDGHFDPHGLAAALEGLPPGEPAVGVLNFPSNPGGYSPTVEERAELRRSLIGIAEQRPFVVVCDDAYAGVVYEDSIPSGSLFWELAGVHEQLIPIKVDGATKEFSFFGGRVGFLTFGVEQGSKAEEALVNKCSDLSRSTVGSPVATSQMILLQALREGGIRQELEAVRNIARERYDAIKPLLADLDPNLMRLLPFNSGFFILIELSDELGLKANDVRRHLLENHSTGIVSIRDRYLRLAICSVAVEKIPELVTRVKKGVEELAEKRRRQ